ncbi:hypothetical protein U0070_015111, partial [Myodes glareolus]
MTEKSTLILSVGFHLLTTSAGILDHEQRLKNQTTEKILALVTVTFEMKILYETV